MRLCSLLRIGAVLRRRKMEAPVNDQQTDPSKLSALELASDVSVDEAAKVKGISRDTFERTYPHLIKRPSARRRTVNLGELLKA